VENSTLKLFGHLHVSATENSAKTNKNQSVNDTGAVGVFKQLLALQTDLKGKTELSEGVKGLPLVGKQLPEELLRQLEQFDESDLAALAEQIVAQEQPNTSQFPGLTSSTPLISVSKSSPVIAQLATQLVAEGSSDSKADVIKGPWTNEQLKNAQAFVGSTEVAEKVLNATHQSSGSNPSAVTNAQLRDEDLLVAAKQASIIQLEATRQQRLSGSNSSRELFENLLRQVEGKLQAKMKSSMKTDASGINKATTADAFLLNRSVFKANGSDAVVTKATQFDALMGSARSDLPVASQASTLNFLSQRGMNRMSGEAENLRASTSTPLTLSVSDTAQHATEQLQRTTGAFRDQLLTPQNEDRLQKAVGERIMRMVESGNWDTEMELNPARLGTIRIRLSMEGSELQVAMSSQNAGVRDLLEASMPRLRDGLSDSGIALANSTVDQEFSQQSGDSKQSKDHLAEVTLAKSNDNGDSSVEHGAQQSSHDGELDTFA